MTAVVICVAELSLITLHWFLTMFASVVHTRILLRLWDLFFYEGSTVLFQVTLGMLKLKVCMRYLSLQQRKPKFHLHRHVSKRHVWRVETSVSSCSVRQAWHSQNAWAWHVERVVWRHDVTSQAFAMSPIFQVDNVCVLHHQRILLCHRHVFKQSMIERSVLRRQKLGTVFCQKWRHQWHCRHLNKNLKLTFFHCHFPACNISPYWCTVTAMLLHLFT